MIVIQFFQNLFNSLGSVMTFVIDKNEALSNLFGQDTSILQVLSISIGAFLVVVLALHVVHLVNPVG